MKNKLILLLVIVLFLPIMTSCSNVGQNTEMKARHSSIYEVAEVENCRITANEAEVKRGAGNSFPTIATLNKNDVVNVMGEIRDWYVIRMDNNQVGCIDSNQAKPIVREDNQVPDQGDPTPERTPEQTQPPEDQPGDTTQPGDDTVPTEPPREVEEDVDKDVDTVSDLTDQEQKMLQLVNSARKKNELPPLKMDKELTRVARIKSRDMVENNYFSHYSPNYGSPFEMMDRFGIEYLHAGENIAANSSVQRAHNSLMNSSGHRRNILSPDFTHVGIGIEPSDKYGYIFTQMFISKPK